jgi:predicted transcriptional regulator
LRPLIYGITTCCPKFGTSFSKEVDVELRNALAHETYWIAQDTTVTPPKFKLRFIDELGDVEKEKPFGEVLFRA